MAAKIVTLSNLDEYVKSLEKCKKMAEEGNVISQLNLVNHYGLIGRLRLNDETKAVINQYGLGDETKAAEWFQKALRIIENEDVDARAQYLLGCLYEGGIGIAQDMEQATKWYLHAAEKNDICAQCSLGFICHRSKDYIQAVEWFRLAAAATDEYYKTGHVLAQFYLGSMYEEGRGVVKDLVQAAEWYTRAKNGCHPFAAERLAALQNQTT